MEKVDVKEIAGVGVGGSVGGWEKWGRRAVFVGGNSGGDFGFWNWEIWYFWFFSGPFLACWSREIGSVLVTEASLDRF